MKINVYRILILNLIIILCNNRVEAKDRISNLVYPVKYFVNHEIQLNDLNDKLVVYQKVGIVGISGIGKTQLARMYAYKNEAQYNVIWFIDCNFNLDEQFSALAKEINIKLAKDNKPLISDNVQIAQKEVIQYLTSKDKWLLIFDNLKLNQNHMLDQIMSWEHNGHIIICSQDSNKLNKIIQLPHFSQKDSMHLMHAILHDADQRVIQQLAEVLNGYPLLIAQGAIFLSNNKHITTEEYKKIINNSRNKVKTHVELVMSNLSKKTKDILSTIAVISNQRFSKKLLGLIYSDDDNFINDFNDIVRYGLIINVEYDGDNQLFEMHNLVKDAIIELSDYKIMKNKINNVIDKLNQLIPQGVYSSQIVINENITMQNSMESLLTNAELHTVDIFKIFELRKNLLNIYLGSRDYHNCQKMVDWFENNRVSDFKLLTSNLYNQSVYAWYLVHAGTFLGFKTDCEAAIKYLEQAKKIMKSIDSYLDLNFTIYCQLAVQQIFTGDIKSALKNIDIVEELIKKHPKDDIDLGLLWHIKAKILLEYGEYHKALDAIEENIKLEIHIPNEIFIAPTYILKANILNYMQKYNESYKLLTELQRKIKNDIEETHELNGRILVQLSRSELGLGNSKKALDYAAQAKNIFLHDKSRSNEDITTSTDHYLAAAIEAEADALGALGQVEEAAKLYSTAEAIFFNKYRNNLNNLDTISFLYWKAAKISYNLSDRFWYNKFKGQHLSKYGKDNLRSIDLINLENNKK